MLIQEEVLLINRSCLQLKLQLTKSFELYIVLSLRRKKTVKLKIHCQKKNPKYEGKSIDRSLLWRLAHRDKNEKCDSDT
ncbi:hypothetical protein QYF36_007606 [Acer negundo]|nr:hypothetical protein QYF36_007606 [Acer negundo]